MGKAIHHIEIYVNNIKETKLFWGWFLKQMGYELYETFENGFSYKLDETSLVFVEVRTKYRDNDYNRCNTGLNHLAFYGETIEFIDSMTKQIKERGLKILYPELHPHAGGNESYGLFFEDPNRIKVEITLE